jgi:hypothetical protein
MNLQNSEDQVLRSWRDALGSEQFSEALAGAFTPFRYTLEYLHTATTWEKTER